ncbi:hypothetical protein EA891_15365 [Salmonella enterica]|nr:hypothetical protein [Salmonella enterica]EEJ6100571.1 hypothetical protein [Salmonella enterica]
MLNYKTATKEQLKEELARLSKVVDGTPFGVTKEFLHLPNILNSDEQPLAVVSGIMDGNTWLLTLTNHRVIFLDKGMVFGLKQIDVSLKDIVSVGGKTKIMFGEILIGTSGQNYTISNVNKSSVTPFTNMVNETRKKLKESENTNDNSVKSNNNDIISQMERLASLKNNGMLSEEEFQQQKQRILNG